MKAGGNRAFPGNTLGYVFNIDPEEIGIILGADRKYPAGMEVRRTGRVLDVPVGEDLLGRVVDSFGRPRDGLGSTHHTALSCGAGGATGDGAGPRNGATPNGLKVVDALIPIGRGQRELILGDRQTGKTAIAIDTIINQKDKDVICIYTAIGKKASDVAKVVADLKEYGAMSYTIVVAATAEDVPGLQFIAPYAATSVGEYFMERGRMSWWSTMT